MLHSWIAAAAWLCFEVVLVCPPGYEPDATMLGIPSVAGASWARGGPLSLRVTVLSTSLRLRS